jgi:nitroreductase
MIETDAADALRPLLRVHQVREFTDAPVEPAVLDAIADAARWSGSSANSQPWRFIVIRKAETLRQLSEANLPSTRSLATAAAAVAIVLPQEKGTAVSNAYDEGRAAERILIAAFLLDLGAGIAWLGADARPAVGELLGLPEGRFVRTLVAIGHPTAKASKPKSTHGEARLPRTETVFRERWDGSQEG